MGRTGSHPVTNFLPNKVGILLNIYYRSRRWENFYLTVGDDEKKKKRVGTPAVDFNKFSIGSLFILY